MDNMLQVNVLYMYYEFSFANRVGKFMCKLDAFRYKG